MSHDEFATLLSGLVGWDVRPGVVERWESYATPPGDIVLAAATLAQEIPGDMLALPLNEGAGRKAAMVSAIGPVLDSMGDSSVISYTDRSLVTQDQWNGIIRGASDCLWLYGMAEYGYAADPETHGIIRGDGRMMVTPYLRFFTMSKSPTFELTSEGGAAMFARYAAHFDDGWHGAREYG
jgi:hypothetical protein